MQPRRLFPSVLVSLILVSAVHAADAPTTSPARFVFVPYEKMSGPQFGKDQSILLPYAEFLRLKNAAIPPGSPDFRPLASLAQTGYKGKVEENVAVFDAEFVIEVVARPTDTLEIQLPFRAASVETASVEGPQASFSPLEKESGMRLTLRGEGRRTLKLRLATSLQTAGALKKIDFGIPRAAASSLTLRVPEDILLETQRDALPATAGKFADGAVEIAASCGSADRVFLAWKPRAEVTGVAAQTRIAVDQVATVNVSAAGAEIKVRVAANLLAGTAKSVVVGLPAGVQLLSVSGPFVKDWSAPDANRQVTVSLVREVTQPFEFTIDAKADESGSTSTLLVPEFRLPLAVRETGTVVVAPDDGLSVWPEELSGIEAIPSAEKDSAGSRRFRFAQPGWQLLLGRRPIPARVRADSTVLYEITDDFARLKSRHHLTIQGRGIFDIAFLAPDGFELREAGPPEVVSGFRQQGRRVEVNFRGEQRAQLDVDLRFQRPRTPADTQQPLEPVEVLGAEEDAGSLVLAAPVALRATELSATGLEATDVRALQQRLHPLISAELVPALGYRFFAPKYRAVASVERQRTRLTCETSLLASVMPSLMKIDATLNYNVEFSAADEFQLLLPASAGEDIRFAAPDIKEKVRAPAGPATTATAELTTWTIRLQRRVIGPYRLSASFDVPLPGTESGKPMTVKIPGVRAVNVAREQGFVAVSRGENLEVSVAKSEGLEPRDVKELPAGLASAFLGFRYFEPERATLELQLVRHELETVLGALIRRLHIDTVVSDQREVVHEALFEVQNNREQYLVLKLPKGMEIWSAFVRGAPVRPTTRESDGARLIELTKSQTKDDAFRVRLIMRETLPGGAMKTSGALVFLPPEPLNMPVLRMTRKLYLPPRYRYVSFGGTMHLDPSGRPSWIEPAAEKLLNDLPAEIAGGVAQPALKPGETRVSPAYDAAETPEEKQARLRGSALEIPVVREGLEFNFSRLSGTGSIEVKFWKTKALLILQGVIAALVFLVVLAGMRGWRRPGFGFAAVVVLFIAASLTGGMGGRLFATALSGASAAFALGLLIYVGKRVVSDRAALRHEKEERRLEQEERLTRVRAEMAAARQEPPPTPPAPEPPPPVEGSTNQEPPAKE
jgi:hypothetical protein